MVAAVLVELERHDRHPGAGQGERGALLRHSAPQHQPTDPCTTLAERSSLPGGRLTTSLLLEAQLHPAVTALILLGAGAGAGAWLVRNRRMRRGTTVSS